MPPPLFRRYAAFDAVIDGDVFFHAAATDHGRHYTPPIRCRRFAIDTLMTPPALRLRRRLIAGSPLCHAAASALIYACAMLMLAALIAMLPRLRLLLPPAAICYASCQCHDAADAAVGQRYAAFLSIRRRYD